MNLRKDMSTKASREGDRSDDDVDDNNDDDVDDNDVYYGRQ